jgi:SAM-dependent methyltransferase
MAGSEYAFTNREQEQQRLESQAELFDPLTERAFAAAGLVGGMRVLDLGSGAGDVALLAARLVGSDGAVVGVERDPSAVASASARVREAGIGNVRFVQGDAQTLDGVEGPFDAAVGRLVLMYLPDPAAAIARAAELVRPGGLVCFQEGDMAYEWAQPMTPLWIQVRAWVLETFARAHIPQRMGLTLAGAFAAAGLRVPEMRLECALGGGPDSPVWGWSNVVTGMVPVMEQLKVATAADIQPDTLAERLLAELRAAQGIVIGPPLIAAWSRLPA